jgi:hypothetical protein
MSAALHIGDIGFWVTNGMRDEFLDWFAEHRCVTGDAQWEFCMSQGNRWPGCDIDLACLFADGQVHGLALLESEIDEARRSHPWGLADLLVLIDQVLVGTWTHRLDAPEAYKWRKPNNGDVPNSGPATQPGKSGVTEGPPSVS